MSKSSSVLRRLISGTPFLVLFRRLRPRRTVRRFSRNLIRRSIPDGVVANRLRVDHLAGLLLVDRWRYLDIVSLRIVDTCLRNARLEAVLRVFRQVGQLYTGFAFEPVE